MLCAFVTYVYGKREADIVRLRQNSVTTQNVRFFRTEFKGLEVL